MGTAALVAVGCLLLAEFRGSEAAVSDPAPSTLAKPTETKGFIFGLDYADALPTETGTALGNSLDDADEVGAGWIRVDLAWYRIEPEAGRWDWSSFDRTVSYAKARGLKVLAILDQPPAWAREASCAADNWCPPADDDAFAAFAAKAAQRYSPDVVGAWEVWNEENLAYYWPGGADPAAYAAMVKSTAIAVHAVRPHAELVLGGMAVSGSTDSNLSAHDFLLGVAQVDALQYVGAIGYHPYSFPQMPGGAAAFTEIGVGPNSLAAVLDQYGAAGTPIWITEAGAPISPAAEPGSSAAAVTAAENLQAEYASALVAAATGNPDVKALFWFSDIDLPAQQLYYGLRRADGTARPAFTALHKAIEAFENSKPTGSPTTS
jgi:polysaccharide biosynthesis protein PslG